MKSKDTRIILKSLENQKIPWISKFICFLHFTTSNLCFISFDILFYKSYKKIEK